MINEYPFPTERIYSGAHGHLIDADGNVIQEVAEFEAVVEPQEKDVILAGTNWIGSKVTGIKGTGKIKLLRISSDLRKKIVLPMLAGTPYVTQLIGEVGNDEGSVERWLFQNVKFKTKVDLIKFTRQDEVEDDLEFTFVGCRAL